MLKIVFKWQTKEDLNKMKDEKNYNSYIEPCNQDKITESNEY